MVWCCTPLCLIWQIIFLLMSNLLYCTDCCLSLIVLYKKYMIKKKILYISLPRLAVSRLPERETDVVSVVVALEQTTHLASLLGEWRQRDLRLLLSPFVSLQFSPRYWVSLCTDRPVASHFNTKIINYQLLPWDIWQQWDTENFRRKKVNWLISLDIR